MNEAVITAINNLVEFHFDQYPGEDTPAPVIERLHNGDWCLTRRAPDGSVTFVEIIDQHTGEFTSACRMSNELVNQIAEEAKERWQGALDLLADR